jgi:TolB-like protein
MFDSLQSWDTWRCAGALRASGWSLWTSALFWGLSLGFNVGAAESPVLSEPNQGLTSASQTSISVHGSADLDRAKIEPITVAVPPFRNEAGPELGFLERTLADAISQEFVNFKTLQVWDRTQIDRQFAEQSLTGSMQHLGTDRSAARLVLGNYSGKAERLRISVKVVDSLGVVVDQEDIQGSLETSLRELQDLGRRLGAKWTGKAQLATLHLKVEPANAVVWLNGKKLGAGSLEGMSLEAGTHQLVVSAGGQTQQRKLQVRPGQVLTERVVLREGPGHALAFRLGMGMDLFSAEQMRWDPGFGGEFVLGYAGPWLDLGFELGLGYAQGFDKYTRPFGTDSTDLEWSQFQYGVVGRLHAPWRWTPYVESGLLWSSVRIRRDSLGQSLLKETQPTDFSGLPMGRWGAGLQCFVSPTFVLWAGVHGQQALVQREWAQLEELLLFPVQGQQVVVRQTQVNLGQWSLRLGMEKRF